MDNIIQWHQAFCAAMEYYFDGSESLEFHKEYNLNTKPLEIDLLVIKKNDNATFENAIGKDFRKYNVFEYKSPDDKLNIDVLYKLAAYGCLYKVSGKHVDEIRADEITLTAVRDTKPEGLLKRLKSEGKLVSDKVPGIYNVSGMLFPLRIVVTGEIPDEHAKVLRYLSKKLNRQQAKDLIALALSAQTDKTYNSNLIDSILQVAMSANKDTFDHLKTEEPEMCEALKEFMKDEIEEMRKKAREEERKHTIYSLVADGDLAPHRGADRLGITTEQLRSDMTAAGYQLPA